MIFIYLGFASRKLKLYQERFKLDIGERFLAQSVAGHWSRLPRKVVPGPNLTEFKKFLDNALKHMVEFLRLLHAGPGAGL